MPLAPRRVYADKQALVIACADWLTDRLASRLSQGVPRIALALSGGNTPRPVFEALASPVRAGRLDWSRIHVFWGDERCVPHDHPDSNYRMTRTALLDAVPIPAANVHAVPTDLPPAQAARAYQQRLQAYYGGPHLVPGRPLFDVNLLGMGADGHTASLFPGSAALEETHDWAVAVEGERPEPRVSLTLPVLASAATVVFLVTGEEKREVALRARHHDRSLPAGRVWAEGDMMWMMDRAAAGAADEEK